jgi:hypothetical protein
VVLGIELRVLHLLGKQSTTSAIPQLFCFVSFVFEMGISLTLLGLAWNF